MNILKKINKECAHKTSKLEITTLRWAEKGDFT